MTPAPTEPAESESAPAPASPRGRDIWRAARAPLIIGGLLLVLAIVAVISRGGTPRGYLETDAANPDGSRALATLLQDRGVAIEPVTTVQAARRTADGNELLLLARPGLLSSQQLRTLGQLPVDRLLIQPNRAALQALAPGVTRAGDAPLHARQARCGLRAARLAGSATMGGAGYQSAGGAGWTCYPTGEGPSLVQVTRDGHDITVTGSARPFKNQYLDTSGNAALAMNLAGSSSSVIWLVPDPLAAGDSAGQQSLAELLPDGVLLAAMQLLVVVLLLALWRMRRHGPVVAERLPVAVRAAETVEGRARLYRSRRARDRSAAALRAGCRSRILPRLGLSADASPPAVTSTVAARTGRSEPEVGAVLYGSIPDDDTALVRLADDLDALETEVRSS